ncbi:hypothetical protein HPP92_016670 [Vanilla planifolia]|uniref:Flap endonuclease 1 n=1 Tax=Vanilla planifolia TaxID=51239 RepID=A0A835QLX5_VANPL|nr:hypothetical protein HPP92_016670 [Vanilla planifolia]
MGIKGLGKLLSDKAPKAMKEETLGSYVGQKIAIDASMSIYQFLISVGRVGTRTLTNEAGEVTSHLQGMFTRTIRLLDAGIKPVYVFDGLPPDLKRQELDKRCFNRENAVKNLAIALETGNSHDIEKFSKRIVKVACGGVQKVALDKGMDPIQVTLQHNEGCKKLLKLMGVTVVEAPSEAEAQCAALCKSGEVYAVASEDMDSLTFGAPRFLRHLMDNVSGKAPIVEFEISKVLGELDLTMAQFVDLCILSGCDYCDGIKGIGARMAFKLIQRHGSIEGILENINRERYRVPEGWPYQDVRHLFQEPLVLVKIPEHGCSPDEEGLMNFLVNENGFNGCRVAKAVKRIKEANSKYCGRLESFYNSENCASKPRTKKERRILSAPSTATISNIFSQQFRKCSRDKVLIHITPKITKSGLMLQKPLLQLCFSK